MDHVTTAAKAMGKQSMWRDQRTAHQAPSPYNFLVCMGCSREHRLNSYGGPGTPLRVQV